MTSINYVYRTDI